MSLKCSIFGHRFGDPVVERSRDESGSEVVITIQEIQTCGRCGQERVVSENKEVTTLETPDDVPAEPEPAQSEPAEQESAAEPEPTPPADEGATILEDADEDPVVQEAESDADDAPTADDLTEPPAEEPSSTEDDGIILEDDEAAAQPERDPGQWPDEPDDDGPEWEPPTDIEDTAEPDPDPEPSPSVEPVGEAVTVPDGTFRCPNCEFTTPVESSSLREGDFCPECHTGTLAHESE